jgi:hypothetical protein
MARRDDAMFVDFAATGRARMRRTAYLICGDWDRAADITQEALTRVYVAWPRLDTHAGLMSYAPHPDARGRWYGVRLGPGVDAAVQVSQSPLAPSSPTDDMSIRWLPPKTCPVHGRRRHASYETLSDSDEAVQRSGSPWF